MQTNNVLVNNVSSSILNKDLFAQTNALGAFLHAIVKIHNNNKSYLGYDNIDIEGILQHKYYQVDKMCKSLIGFNEEVATMSELIQSAAGNVNTALDAYKEHHMKGFSKEERQQKGKVYTKDKSIVKWIHDKLEQYNPIDLHKTYWEPACGTGSFVIDWYDRLMTHWENNKEKYEFKTKEEAHKHILEHCIYFSDIDPFAIRLCRLSLFLKMPKVKTQFNSYCGDSLLDDPFTLKGYTRAVDKFDYIAGNPPYGDSEAAKGRKTATKPLWFDFIEIMLQRVQVGCCIAMITPSAWLQHTSKIHYIFKQHCREAKVYSKSPFPGVLTTASCWLLQNISHNGQVKVELDDLSNVVLDLSIEKFLPANFDKFITKMAILDKTINASTSKFDMRATQEHHTESKVKELSKNQSAINCYPIFHTNTQTLWSSKKGDLHNIPKVIISKTGTINKAVVGTSLSISQIAIALVTKTDTEASIALTIIQSRLYKALINMVRVNSTIPSDFWRSLPAVDLTHVWTDSELYDHFNLTPDEIKVVEEALNG